jgi:hypothetical protein
VPVQFWFGPNLGYRNVIFLFHCWCGWPFGLFFICAPLARFESNLWFPGEFIHGIRFLCNSLTTYFLKRRPPTASNSLVDIRPWVWIRQSWLFSLRKAIDAINRPQSLQSHSDFLAASIDLFVQ